MEQQIAKTIMSQLGGYKRLRVMVNAKWFTTDNDKNLQFHFSGSRLFNCVNIQYDFDLDLYNMTFYKIGKIEVKNEETFSGVYADMLVDIFESETKLRLSL